MILELLKSEGTDERLLNATVEVTDDDGEIVLEFPFAEALLDSRGCAGDAALAAASSEVGPSATENDRDHFDAPRYTASCISIPAICARIGHCFRLPSGGKISETIARKAYRGRQRLPARGIRLPIRENVHEERHVRVAQPFARRRFLQCIYA